MNRFLAPFVLGFLAAGAFITIDVWWFRIALCFGIVTLLAKHYFDRKYWYRRVVAGILTTWAAAHSLAGTIHLVAQIGGDALEGGFSVQPPDWSFNLACVVLILVVMLVERQASMRSSGQSNSVGDQTRSTLSEDGLPLGLHPFELHQRDTFIALASPRAKEIFYFWKSQLSGDRCSCPIGVIYGPSGSGKTSLVRAGIASLETENVRCVIIDAFTSDLELELRTQIAVHFSLSNSRKELPNLISQALEGQSGNQASSNQRRVLFVFDQFEKWLLRNKDIENSLLVKALRQFDGRHLMCLLVVADHFYFPLDLFMRGLGIEIENKVNFCALDSLTHNHAAEILKVYGDRLDRWPVGFGEEQKEVFATEVIQTLSSNNRINPSHLAMFVETTRYRSWSRETARQLESPSKLGIEFLKESFDSSTGHPVARRHARGAKEILRRLTNPGSVAVEPCSAKLLADIANLHHESDSFLSIINMLECDLRLICPVPPSVLPSSVALADVQYRLTHDFWIEPIKTWVELDELNSFSGRARLELRNRCNLWILCGKSSEAMPSILGISKILLGTSRSNSSTNEQEFVQRFTQRNLWDLIRLPIVFFLFLLAEFCVWIDVLQFAYVSSHSRFGGFLSFIDFFAGTVVFLALALPLLNYCLLRMLKVCWSKSTSTWTRFVLCGALAMFLIVGPLVALQVIPYTRAMGFFAMSSYAFEIHERPLALQLADKAVQLYPNDYSFRMQRGRLLDRNGEFELAKRDLLIVKNQADARLKSDAVFYLAWIANDQDDSDAFESYFSDLQLLAPADTDIGFLMAVRDWRAGKLPESYSRLSKLWLAGPVRTASGDGKEFRLSIGCLLLTLVEREGYAFDTSLVLPELELLMPGVGGYVGREMTEEQFLASKKRDETPINEIVLAQFLIAQRRLKEGDYEVAIRHFKTITDTQLFTRSPSGLVSSIAFVESNRISERTSHVGSEK